jgi:DNA polymerase I-like protein with 3'-5' exonuclease and polymerase domains
MYKITKRKMTMDDFIDLKKYDPVKKHRQDSKAVNFGSIFGAIGSTLGSSMKSSGFSEDDVDEAIDTFGLENVLNTALSLGKAKKGVKALKYAIVGDKLRELFFQTYPGLMKRIEREQRFALDHGYVRTWNGPVRHLPELKYMKFNAKGTAMLGSDSILYSKMFAHLKNEACNSTIQTAEVYWAMPNATAFNHYMKKWGLKSRIFSYTHDSYEMYIYKTELEVVKGLIKELCNINRQPYYGIPMDMSMDIADLTKPNQYLKHGDEVLLDDAKLPEGYDFDPSIVPIHGEVK